MSKNVILLNGSNLSKEELIATIRAINSDEMDPIVINYDISIELRKRIAKDAIIVDFKGITDKVAFAKLFKDSLGGLHVASEMTERVKDYPVGEYTIEEFVSKFLQNKISVPEFEKIYSANEKILSPFLKVLIK